ncbi:hypothetical protein GKZ90_0014025 [Flavobacterium sp. MC2016-06]|jgi:hypothetical protein|uniref:hypothetical protein n=1 Tax=Flavobacterium sp. MC2016-06 TaxID=2676308 RepID=UPI0012BAB327|nr:hypothetical protein [Flavobacterium sp. MC2016-06]MBU3861715.1 hypothetical protein [Flavobacterium sp. MC2016-06]
MKKLILFIYFVSLSLISQAQSIPDCAKNSVNSRLFLNGPHTLLCDSISSNASPSNINQCFAIRSYQIRDTLNINYFKIYIYKNINDFANKKKKKTPKMEIYFTNIIDKDSFNYYLDISKFKKGSFFINVSKKNNVKAVECVMCRDSIKVFDVTPKNWSEIKKWGD